MTDEHKKFLKNIVELHQTFGSGASKTVYIVLIYLVSIQSVYFILFSGWDGTHHYFMEAEQMLRIQI